MTALTLPPLPDPTPAAEVIAAIAALRPGEWIATDADETLWAADVGDEVVRFADKGVPPWRQPTGTFAWYLREMATGDYAGACRYATKLLGDVDADAARAALAPVLAQVRLRPWLARALQEARQRGVLVGVVSASPAAVVTWTTDLVGLHVDRIIGIELRDGEVVEPASVGHGKVQAWQSLGLPQPALALGDSKWDAPLLHAAQRGMALIKASHDTGL